MTKSFKDYERDGWNERAVHYDDHALPLTRQGFAPLIEALRPLDRRRVLDVACGTGHFTARLADAGAEVLGIDISRGMVTEARRHYPGVLFEEADSEALPFLDASYDDVVCCFGLLHMERPETAMAEAFRVLEPGGRFAFTVWCGPDQENAFFETVLGAVTAHADMNVDLPPAPPMFRLADGGTTSDILSRIGFVEREKTRLPIVWHADRADAVVEFLNKSTVRTSLLLDHQTAEVRAKVLETLIARLSPLERPDGISLACPAVMVVAVKP